MNIVNKNDCRQHVENSAENRNQTKQKVDKLKQYFCLFCVCLGFGVSINGISVLIFLRPTLQNNETIPAIHIQTKQKMINFVSVFCLFIDAFSNGIPPNEKRLKLLCFFGCVLHSKKVKPFPKTLHVHNFFDDPPLATVAKQSFAFQLFFLNHITSGTLVPLICSIPWFHQYGFTQYALAGSMIAPKQKRSSHRKSFFGGVPFS